VSGPTVRVEVFDGTRRLPRKQRPALEAESGRGLQVVEALATTWGTDSVPSGKVVWFELHEQ
jgi:hypothetical protein